MNSVISTEQISVNHKSKLATDLRALLIELREETAFVGRENVVRSTEERLAECIKKNTHLNVIVDIHNGDVPFLVTMLNVAGQHNSVNRRPEKSLFEKDPHLLKFVNGSVDLEHVKVDGSFRLVPAKISISSKVFFKLTDEMITAGILHEVGHLFWSFATIGDYVWMNYYLQEGVEVMLGNKPNRYKIKTMTVEELKKVTDEESRKRLNEEVNPTTLRRAVIGLYTDTNRGFVSSVSDSSTLKRDEQLADWFVSRLGYGLPLAKYVKIFIDTSGLERDAWIRELALIPAMLIPGINIAVITWSVIQLQKSSDIRSSYDSPVERIRKMRRDAIYQISLISNDRKRLTKLLRDIEEFDKLLAPLYDVPNAVDIVGMLISPNRRRNIQHLRLERQLESFLNNDLFVTHSKLRQFIR